MSELRFAILGPLSVTDDGRDVAITAGRDRVVLAMLLLHQGRIVSANDLIDAVWEGSPPATARGQLQTCVSRLRRTLPTISIQTHPEGYGVKLGADELDATTFARLVAEARAETAPDEARRRLRAALDLWRGVAFDGIESRPVRQAAAVLDERYAAATEDWIDLELERGRARDRLADLIGLVERFPLRERLRAQLMLALSRVGRQADALAEYHRGRDILRDELGIEPSAVLRDVHQRLLAGKVETPVVRASTVSLNALPRAVGDFTGRTGTVDRLVREIREGDAGTPMIKVIDGMPGSGKTTLALHVANMVADRYPDAQLFVDLHGNSDREPAEPAAALVTLLRQLGVSPDRIPGDLDGRVALWRGELAGRRALVVLDNAAGTAQVSHLLPASPGCLGLVTSRRRLAGLDGIRPESIPLLTEEEGVELLARIVGDRVVAEHEAAVEVVRRCGRLPLAIRLAGSRLAHRQRWRVADLVRRLGEHGTALPEMIAEDRTVVSAFALSYSQLAASEQRAFRLLGLHPGERFDVAAVAALTGLSADGAEDLLDDLVDMHLVEEPEPGVFRLHDLMREYAATLAAGDPGETRRGAIAGLLDFHLHAAVRATRSVDRDSPGTELTLDAELRPELADGIADPATWFERERAALPRLADAAIAADHPEYAWLLAWASWLYLFQRGYIDEIIEIGRRGETAARAVGDRRALAAVLNCLASAYYRSSNYPEALELLRESAQLRRGLGDRSGEAALLGNLSSIHESVGELHKAMETSQRALELRRRLRDDKGIVKRLLGLAIPLMQLGEHAEAERHLRRALLLSVEAGDGLGVAMSLSRLGNTRLALGRPDFALRFFRAAQTAGERAGYALGRAEVLSGQGRVSHAQGDYAKAVELHERALAVSSELGDPRSRCIGLNDLGRALAATGRTADGLARFREAREVAATVHHPYEQARALDGIAACLADEEPAEALRHWQQALVIYARMGVPVGADVKRRIAELRAR
jgi:DNA-binding SARP family transcriptional activator/tetratricopeptide (TPR) repeat protein